MANNETLIPIPGRLHSVATEGHVAGADEIIDDTLNKDQATINSEVNTALGTGGTVDQKIEAALEDVAFIDDSSSSSAVVPSFDPESQTVHVTAQTLSESQKAQVRENIGLGDVDARISEAVASEASQRAAAVSGVQASVNAEATRAQAAEADRYTKSETYTKEEVHNLVTTPNQEYVSVTATAQTTAVTDVLPATGAADTTYRVGNWDGTQYNDYVFSEYAWNGSAYIKLSTKSQVGEVYDISANHADTKYADLAAALGTNGANVPEGLRKGGMSVKFVQSSDNKYVQYRLMSAVFSTATYDWQNIGEFYPEVNYICDADYYKWIPCNLPAGEWKITLYNASPNHNATAAFKDANGDQFYYTKAVPSQQTMQFIVELEKDAALVATAFVGSKLIIEKVSYNDKEISELQDDVSELQRKLVGESLYSIIADDADYKSYPCVLEPGKYSIRCTNARTDISVTVSFKNSNNEDIYISDSISPSATAEFTAELSESSVVMLTAGVGTTVDIFSYPVIYELQDDVSELQSELLGDFTETLITVDINGTIGVDCDYNDIQTALDSITDNTKQKRYVVFVKNGIYDITGISYLGFKNYVTVRGETRDGVIIRNSTPTGDQSIVCFDPAKYGNNIIDYASIETMTLRILSGKCCVHIDSYSIKIGGKIVINDILFINENPDTNCARGGVNCGLNGGQTVEITNCYGNVLVYAHTRILPSTYLPANNFIIKNCHLNFIGFYDLNDKVANNDFNRLIVDACICDYIGIGVGSAGSASVSTAYCSIRYEISNSTKFNWVYIFGQATVQDYDAWFTKYPICSTIHRVAANYTGSTIAKGTFVSVLRSSSNGLPSPDNAQPAFRYNIVPYSGGELFGIACEDIVDGDCGIIQVDGKILIANNNYNAGDYITLSDAGVPMLGNKQNAIGIVTDANQQYFNGTFVLLKKRDYDWIL